MVSEQLHSDGREDQGDHERGGGDSGRPMAAFCFWVILAFRVGEGSGAVRCGCGHGSEEHEGEFFKCGQCKCIHWEAGKNREAPWVTEFE